MPNLIGLKINTIPFDSSDLANLKLIFKKLKHLIVNYKTSLPKEINQFDNLQGIGFTKDKFNEIPEFFENDIYAPNITNIALEYNHSSNLIKKIYAKFPTIKEFYFTSSSKLSDETYIELGVFKNLKSLVINQHSNTLNRKISLLKNIETLIIELNHWQSEIFFEFNLDSISDLPNLKRLELRNFDKIKYSDQSNKLVNLECLSWSKSRLGEFSIDERILNRLKRLELISVNLTKIPLEIYSAKNLEYLDLSYNMIESIDENIENLKNLRFLNLSENKLKSLPKNLNQLLLLSNINIEYNEVDTLYESFTNLKALDTISMRRNKLKTLPKKFGDLINIKYLDLRCNNLISFPYTLKNLSKVEFISFDNFCEKVKNDGIKTRNSINRLALNFTLMKNIKYLDIGICKTNKSTFESLWSKPLNFDVIKFSETESLPSSGWSNKQGKFLGLGLILDGLIPDSLFYSNIKCITFSIFKSKSKKRYEICDETSKKYVKFKLGKITLNAIRGDTTLLNYIANMQAKNYDDFKIMIDIDSTLAIKKINLKEFIYSLYDRKEYNQVIGFIDLYLSDSTYKLSEKIICETLELKNNCLFSLGRNEEIIKNKILLDSLYNYNYSAEIGIYYLSKGNKKDANKYFKKNIDENYFNLSNARLEKKPKVYLNLIEALFLIEDYKAIDSLISNIDNNGIQFGNYKKVYTYFKLIRKIIMFSISTLELEEFKSQIRSSAGFDINWSCYLISKWGLFQEQKKKEKIEFINKLLCPSNNDFNFMSVDILKYKANIKK